MIEKIEFTLTPIDAGHTRVNGRLSREEINELIKLFPVLNEFERTPGGYITYESDAHSELSKAILKHIEELGKPIQYSFERLSEIPNSFNVSMASRRFTDGEMEGANYFQVQSDLDVLIMDHVEVSKCKELVLKSGKIKSDPVIGTIAGWFDKIVCNQAMVDLLKQQNFIGLELEPIKVMGKKSSGEPVYAVRSSYVCGPMLSKISNGKKLIRTEPQHDGSLHISDRFWPQLIKYSDEEYLNISGVDLALTSESLGDVDPDKVGFHHIYKSQQVLCSQRFRKWALENNLPFTFIPVQFGSSLASVEVDEAVKGRVTHEERSLLSSAINEKISDDDSRVSELSADERTVYCLERLSELTNMSGSENFFISSIAPLYLPIIDGLNCIGATLMVESLEAAKEICLGDLAPTEENILEEELETSARHDAMEEEVTALFGSSVDSDFHIKLRGFEDDLIIKATSANRFVRRDIP